MNSNGSARYLRLSFGPVLCVGQHVSCSAIVDAWEDAGSAKYVNL